MKMIPLGLVLLLSGCGLLSGTRTDPAGTTFIDVGQFGPLQGLSIADGKDRQAVRATYASKTSQGCDIPGRKDLCKVTDSNVAIETLDSNGSTAQANALAAQSAAMEKVMGTLEQVLGAIAPLLAQARVATVP